MISSQDYRIDKQTGAVIFKKSAGKRKSQQMEKDIKTLKEKVERLEQFNEILIKILQEKGVNIDEFTTI